MLCSDWEGDRCIVAEVYDPKKSTQPSQDWAGLRELDEALAENRLTEYRIKKAWADPINRIVTIAVCLILAVYVGYVMLADFIL